MKTTETISEPKKINLSSAGNQKGKLSDKMMALVYHGPSKKAWEEKPMPRIKKPTDAIVKIVKTTICGTDLHIMKGDLPDVTDGRIIGHEGVGIVEETGSAVSSFKNNHKKGSFKNWIPINVEHILYWELKYIPVKKLYFFQPII